MLCRILFEIKKNPSLICGEFRDYARASQIVLLNCVESQRFTLLVASYCAVSYL